MRYVQLGRSGLRVSKLCLGTMNFGPVTPEHESHAIMDQALELGINFFDTANVYGWKKGQGWTEEIIGRWLAKNGRRRASIVLATKVFGEMGDGPNDRGLSAYHIRKACDESLRRLRVDHIDLYQMHHVDRATPFEETWQAMEQLLREGKISYVGSSNFPAWCIAKAQTVASLRGGFGLLSEQCIYSLADRTPELEVIPAVQHFGIGLIPWSPLGGGMLAGIREQTAGGRRAGEWAKAKLEKHRDAVGRYEDFCKGIKANPAEIALAWVLANPAVTAPIVGPRSGKQLTDAVRTLDMELDDDVMTTLDAIWPGPGGQAPEAYSW